MTKNSATTVNWKKYYVGVIALMVAEIVLFYYITRQFV
jgi:hypothetical protein